MSISETCNREVVAMQRNDCALKATSPMRQHHVGDVLVAKERTGLRIPPDIGTDRDLAMEIMAPELATVKESTELFDAIQYMCAKEARRLPVVNDRGELVGILTLNDLLEFLSEKLQSLSSLLTQEQTMATALRH